MASGNGRSRSAPPDMGHEVRRWFARLAVGLVAYGAALFYAAGTLRWPWGWAFLSVYAGASLAHSLLLLRTNPALLVQRAKGLRDEDAPRWDKAIASLAAGALPLVSWIAAALDVRHGWGPGMPPSLHWVGAAAFGASWTLILWATYANRFFTTTARIQPHHTVQTDGPYRYVRHPGYVGAAVYVLSCPFVLGSWWALVPAAAAAALFVLRTALEDRFLKRALDGYNDYAARVRFRLVPGIW